MKNTISKYNLIYFILITTTTVFTTPSNTQFFSLKTKKLIHFDSIFFTPFFNNSNKIFNLWIGCVSQHA